MSEKFISQNNKFTTDYRQTPISKEDQGVATELQRFAMNEYLDTRNRQVLIGANDTVADNELPPDDMLLTNAVTENVVQNNIDHTRYVKETKVYITVNSGARNQTVSNTGSTTQSIFSTGSNYYPVYPFAPYSLATDSNGNLIQVDGEYVVILDTTNNNVQFQLQDIKIPTQPIQILTPNYNDTFSIYLTANRSKIKLSQLQTELETNLNLMAATGHPLDDSPDPTHMYTVLVLYEPLINPGRASINVFCQDNFQFSMTFYSYGNIEQPGVGRLLPATEAAYVVQDPMLIYPYPCSYALTLDKTHLTVKAIRIVSSEMPNTDTIINSYNNHITFRLINRTLPPPTPDNPYSQNIKMKDGNIDWDVYIQNGNYNLDQLIAQIELQINNLLFGEAQLSDIFKFEGNQITNIFEISVDTPYAFQWNFNANSTLLWRNLYSMLGYKDSYTKLYVNSFTNLVSTLQGKYTVQTPYRAIVLRKSNIIWLQLNNYETIYDTLTQNYFFCKFSLDNVSDGQYAIDTFTPDVHVFVDSPLAELATVDVRLYDEVGMPYNFNGIDHSFTLEITNHIDRVMGNDFSSRRGVNDRSSYV